MSVHGVGVDVESIPRMAAIVDRYGQRFVRRWFDPSELPDRDVSPVHLATRFAAKEAVWKALRLAGDDPLAWRQITVTPDDYALTLSVRLEGHLRQEAESLGIGAISVTTTRLGDGVLAMAVAERADPQ